MELTARRRAILGALHAAGAVADLCTWNWPQKPAERVWAPLPREVAELRSWMRER